MGYNTCLMILNDNFSEIEREPAAFVSSLNQRMLDRPKGELRVPVRGQDGQIYGYRHVGEVMHTEHADVTQVVVVHGNTANTILAEYHLGYEPEIVLKALADKLGYNISKKPSKKEKTIDPATDTRQELMAD